MTTNRLRLRKIRMTMAATAVPVATAEIISVILIFTHGIWWPFLIYLFIAVPYGIWLSKYYYDNVSYMCPHCNKVFSPTFKEMIFAAHTPTRRRLTCTDCGSRGWCTEVAKEGL